MSSPIEWNVIVFDKPNTDRTSVRKSHLEKIPGDVNSGVVTSVGAIYQDAEKTKFAGSCLNMFAKSREDILEFLKGDPYYKAGIWDLDSVIANPCGIAVRLPKIVPGVSVNDDLFKL
ncbi:hypothetical protein PSN45_003831 [Yamadazyma tenuis]|uniref:YCII-related domain-containing protein n=1 Tax=Candida tenuis (strain ATCC 10573 / BCRC 21748 / CBS 615 / JCM 9827 / NBRC 10315 / NRRL Y-1498 / VKM Y-70) TaxID=590646 RepID=G3B343_CANTC|nr:uncharacterized protein CANTEDRAFT_114111 [Yamadazyma tenuis ATCC 10573]EGV64074.1 hypothetical protein CANTEDRAFT_114111 [Yamadazyma tenuis ATCC 10573]WEJ96294.1 hypothetical protein PSN45_003831 [Yamadazyma tenuis]